MPIRFTFHPDDARGTPVVVCDVCGQRIDDARWGAAILLGEWWAAGPYRTVDFAHKLGCLDHYGGGAGWQELTSFLAELLHSAKGRMVI